MPSTRTFTVAFQLRVPSKVRVDDVKAFVETAIVSEPGTYRKNDPLRNITLYKQRIEVFAP